MPKSRITYGARIGAAAFALGLSLAGAQVPGIALADTQADTETPAVGPRTASKTSAPQRRESVVRSGRDRAAAADGQSPSAPAPAASRRKAGVPAAERVASVSAVTTSPGASDSPSPSAPAAVAALAPNRVSARVSTSRAASATVATTVSAAAVQGGAAPQAASVAAVSQAATAPTTGAVTSFGTVVGGLLDAAVNFLSAFPANPITEVLAGALSLLRRNLFDDVAVLDPDTHLVRANGELVGNLGAFGDTSDELTYQIVDGPDLGDVVLDSTGTYTYTPGADFAQAGNDTFQVKVTDPGFDAFDPFADRTSLVTVQVANNMGDGPMVGSGVTATKTFSVTNLTTGDITYAGLTADSGYQDAVLKPLRNGTVLHPGDTVYFDSTQYFGLWNSYDLKAKFTAPGLNLDSGSRTWAVNMHVDSWSLGSTPDASTATCTGGNCGFTRPDGWSRNGNVFLQDPAGTYEILSGEGQKQAAVLDAVCEQSGATCSFVPNRNSFVQTVTPWRVISRTINRGNTTVTQRVETSVEEGTTSAYTLRASAKVAIAKVVDLGVEQETSQSWTRSEKISYSKEQPVAPGFTGIIEVSDPIKQVTGDFTATFGNVTYVLRDVVFYSPDPDPTRSDGGVSTYQTRSEPNV